MNNDFKSYLHTFEKSVVISGVENGVFTKEGKVAVKECKLCNTPFGEFIDTKLKYNRPMAIDYYGLIKKSAGMMAIVDGYKNIEIKSIIVPIVHFASIKHEHISSLAPELLSMFSGFKEYLIELRGFKLDKCDLSCARINIKVEGEYF